MNRTIEQWQAINPKDVAYNATTGAVQHLVQSAISDLQELARQRDELLAALELCRYDSLNMSMADMEKVRKIYQRIKEQTK